EPPAGEYDHRPAQAFAGVVVVLRVGRERRGEGVRTTAGNLTYAVGTPFQLRSLVPDWINRPYRTYRVQQPFEALTGVAIPWFEQPGGGTAYLLPHAIEDMLEDGYLVEVPGREPPPMS
ncbi:TNT domain-containing protein, partial [Kibdelosporangium lantanae]